MGHFLKKEMSGMNPNLQSQRLVSQLHFFFLHFHYSLKAFAYTAVSITEESLAFHVMDVVGTLASIMG
jgi:hypothetical protein